MIPSGRTPQPVGLEAELAVDCRNSHGEGVLWNPADARVWWTDIHGKAMHWLHPATGGFGMHALACRLCAFAPRQAGGWLMGYEDAIEICDDRFGTTQRLHVFEPDKPGTRLNDGRTDRSGRFVVGGYDEATDQAITSVLRLGTDRAAEPLIGSVTCANAICFSPDGHWMHFADTPTRRLLRYPYGPDGVGAPELLADLAGARGYPDGACVDAEGGVWNAQWQGGEVLRIDPSGRITHRVAVPAPKVTCCAFGGPGLATLYISTSRLGSTTAELADAPLSGGLFAVQTGFAGIEDHPYCG